jgi:hypothetical protein
VWFCERVHTFPSDKHWKLKRVENYQPRLTANHFVQDSLCVQNGATIHTQHTMAEPTPSRADRICDTVVALKEAQNSDGFDEYEKRLIHNTMVELVEEFETTCNVNKYEQQMIAIGRLVKTIDFKTTFPCVKRLGHTLFKRFERLRDNIPTSEQDKVAERDLERRNGTPAMAITPTPSPERTPHPSSHGSLRFRSNESHGSTRSIKEQERTLVKLRRITSSTPVVPAASPGSRPQNPSPLRLSESADGVGSVVSADEQLSDSGANSSSDNLFEDCADDCAVDSTLIS